MVRTLVVFLILLILFSSLVAGTTGKISGFVKDKNTGEPLPGVNILLVGTTLGASTDHDGYYVIVNVPVGLHELQVSYIGYKEILIKNIRVLVLMELPGVISIWIRLYWKSRRLSK